jgi:hypothetical protein
VCLPETITHFGLSLLLLLAIYFSYLTPLNCHLLGPLDKAYYENFTAVERHWNIAQRRESILDQARIYVRAQGWKEAVDKVADYIEK